MKMHKPLRIVAWVAALALPTLLLAQDRLTPSVPLPGRGPNAWQPDTDGRERFRPIIEQNIFRANRAELNRPPRVETPEVDRPEPETPNEEPPVTPSDPDRKFVLRGMTLRGSAGFAFIENLDTGETTRVAVPGEFAQGYLSDATLDGLTYTLDDGAVERQLATGQTLTGEVAPRGSSIARNAGDSPAPSDTTTPATAPAPGAGPTTPPTPGAAPGGDDGLSELERRLRERRQRGE